MQLTEKELALVSRAENSIMRAKVGRIILLLVLVAGFASMLYGVLSPDYFAYLAVAAVVYAIYLPQLGGPPYDELVELLIRVRSSTKQREIDPLIGALTQKP